MPQKHRIVKFQSKGEYPPANNAWRNSILLLRLALASWARRVPLTFCHLPARISLTLKLSLALPPAGRSAPLRSGVPILLTIGTTSIAAVVPAFATPTALWSFDLVDPVHGCRQERTTLAAGDSCSLLTSIDCARLRWYDSGRGTGACRSPADSLTATTSSTLETLEGSLELGLTKTNGCYTMPLAL